MLIKWSNDLSTKDIKIFVKVVEKKRYNLKDIINKFELVYSVKEERTKKLKRLKKII